LPLEIWGFGTVLQAGCTSLNKHLFCIHCNSSNGRGVTPFCIGSLMLVLQVKNNIEKSLSRICCVMCLSQLQEDSHCDFTLAGFPQRSLHQHHSHAPMQAAILRRELLMMMMPLSTVEEVYYLCIYIHHISDKMTLINT